MRDSVAQIVGNHLLDGEPRLDAIAKQLGMTERTLRRSLHDEGVSYRLLVDEVRRQRAESMLVDASVSIAEIAFALGFSDHAAFTRAYKRWTGMTPADRRRALGGES